MTFTIPQNLPEQIADFIGEKIIRMEMKPGERIFEARIAEELKVSRSPVREAMRILEKYRLVELNPRRGARVTEMSREYIDWLFDILAELFGLAARLCVKHRTDDMVKMMAEIEQKATDCVNGHDFGGYFDAVYHYGLIALKAANNPLLEQLVRDWLPSFRRACYVSLARRSHDLTESLSFLQELTRQGLNNDPALAADIVKAYTLYEKKQALRFHEDCADISTPDDPFVEHGGNALAPVLSANAV